MHELNYLGPYRPLCPDWQTYTSRTWAYRSSSSWSFEPEAAFITWTMEYDEEIVEAIRKQFWTRPPVRLQDFEVQYTGQRPVQEHVISPPCLAPVYVTHLQPPWDNPDQLQWWCCSSYWSSVPPNFSYTECSENLPLHIIPAEQLPQARMPNEVQAICREDAQSHQIFRADLFELKEVHTPFKELM